MQMACVNRAPCSGRRGSEQGVLSSNGAQRQERGRDRAPRRDRVGSLSQEMGCEEGWRASARGAEGGQVSEHAIEECLARPTTGEMKP